MHSCTPDYLSEIIVSVIVSLLYQDEDGVEKVGIKIDRNKYWRKLQTCVIYTGLAKGDKCACKVERNSISDTTSS